MESPTRSAGPAPRDTGEWRRAWVAEGGRANGAPGTGGPEFLHPPVPSATPSPQPPPPAWDERDSGPGSPAGSIRPPDTTGTVEPPPNRAVRGFGAGLAGALVGAALGTAATLAVVRATPAFDAPSTSADAPAAPVQAPVVELPSGSSGSVVAAVAAAVTPSVVRIDVLDSQRQDGEIVTVPSGVGSGVIYRSDGLILTNNHVVEGADEVKVRFSDGESVDAEIVGTDPLTDLAVLRVDRSSLPAINLRLGDLAVGEVAIAIGTPFGLDTSVTAGVISALNRDLTVPPSNGRAGLTIPAVIQTDAAINPGNSGGALVDAEGRLMGINTAILTGSQGVGFAVPTPSVVSAADQLIERGFVSHPFLGISGFDVGAELAARYEDEFGIVLDGGAVIDRVIEDSGAAEAGLRAEDIIVEIDGVPVASMSQLTVRIRDFAPGDVIEVTVLRAGERLDFEVTLGERPR